MQQDLRRFVLALVLTALAPLTAFAWERGEVERFATLPAGNSHPEGVTADRQGNIYVTTADFQRPGGLGRLFVFNPQGQLRHFVDVKGSSNVLAHVEFHPHNGALLIADLGGKQVLNVNPRTGDSSVFTTIPGAAGPEAFAFDKEGNVYISDAFQGTIWKTGPWGGPSVAWVTSPLLKSTSNVNPFGANGLGFNKAGNKLFVANTGNDQIIEIPVTAMEPGTPKVFVSGVNGPDGLLLDDNDNLWIPANQSNEIVVVDPTGRVVAKLGDFDGIGQHGAVRGLLFPASVAKVGDWIYVASLAIDLRQFGIPSVDAQWAAEVKRHTVSRLKAEIPRVRRRD